MLKTPGVISGNAAEESAGRRGWLLGHFLDGAGDPRATSAVEVKWAVYEGGERRAGWGVNERAHTLALLVRGRFRLRFPERDVLLASEGDYVLWEPGVPHLWQAETAAIVVTVRWPSLPGDSRDVGGGGGEGGEHKHEPGLAAGHVREGGGVFGRAEGLGIPYRSLPLSTSRSPRWIHRDGGNRRPSAALAPRNR